MLDLDSSTQAPHRPSQLTLLAKRRFAPLFVTQFLGAFNDNLFKNALVVLLTFQAATWTRLDPGVLANIAAGLFILPFFLFSATAGQLADKFDKARLARLTKLLEIIIMAVAGLGFALENLVLLLTALFLMGLQSTLFGPLKYALLPQHLRPDELIGGNALVEAGTFVAILLGTLAGGLLAGLTGGTLWITGMSLLLAVLGYLASRGIPPAPAPQPELALDYACIGATWRCIGLARANRSVFLAILAISWFWLYGALFLTQIPAYTRLVLGGDESMVTLLLATFCVGIGSGSLFCERLSRHRIEIGLVPLGALGMTLFGLDFAWVSSALAPSGAPLPLSTLLEQGRTWRLLLDLLLLGASGGLYCVPLYALMQARSHPDQRARNIAANNIMNALFMVLGALLAAALLAHGWRIPGLFALAAVANALAGLYLCAVAPRYLRRCLRWLGWNRPRAR